MAQLKDLLVNGTTRLIGKLFANEVSVTKINDVTVGSSPKFTDTTYSNKSAASGGTDVSLVTTGEKYTWNNKLDKSGGAMTGDLSVGSATIGTNGYVQGTWLRTSATSDNQGNFATLSNGWIYYRTPAETREDIGAAGIETGTWAVGPQTFRYYKIGKLVTVYGTFVQATEAYATLKNLPFAIDTNCVPESGIFHVLTSGAAKMCSMRKVSATEIAGGGGINITGTTISGQSGWTYFGDGGMNFCISYICQ